MRPTLTFASAVFFRMLVVLALAGALGSGCQRAAVGQSCYEVEFVLEQPSLDARQIRLMKSGRGDLSGWINYGYSADCHVRVVRVVGAEVEEVLCLHDQWRETVDAWAGDLGVGLFLVVSGPSEWLRPEDVLPCSDEPLSYQLWDLSGGLQNAFSSPYRLTDIVSPDRFLGMPASCDGSTEPAYYLVDDAGLVLREHLDIGGCCSGLVGIDPSTRDYFLAYDDGSIRGYDADGVEKPLMIGEATDCRFAGAQAGVHAFLCPRDGAMSFLVGRSGGPVASVDLSDNGWGAVGGGGTIAAVGLDSGWVEVYRYEQDRLELLWTVNLHGEEYYVFIGQGSDPLIGVVGSDDGNMHVFDLQGRPVLGGSSYWGRHVGDVGGYVTFFGDQILTYRITRRTGCTPPGG